MASTSDLDAATEALIAQLMAEDLGESYNRHSAPIGASYYDYEEPLSSYERQCLDAENDPDEAGEEGSGWGPDQVDHAAPALGDGLCADDGPAGEEEGTWDSGDGNWDSRFVDEDGQIREQAEAPEQGSLSASEDDDGALSSHCSSSSSSSDAESTGSPARVVVSGPTNNVPTNMASEAPNVSAPSTSMESGPCLSLRPTQVPDDHIDAPRPLTSPSNSPLPPPPNNHGEPPALHPTSTKGEPERQWFDNQDYPSPNNNNSKPVRAYDEYKQGLRTHHHSKPWPRFVGDSGSDPDIDDDDYDTDSDEEKEEEGELNDLDDEHHLPFIRIPWPSSTNDEIRSRQEDAQVVEIRVGEEETLDSILRDISIREKGKGVLGREGEEEGVGVGRADVVACRVAVADS